MGDLENTSIEVNREDTGTTFFFIFVNPFISIISSKPLMSPGAWVILHICDIYISQL